MEILEFDAVVVGGGLAGLSAAVRLLTARKELRVAIVFQGTGASACISGLNAVIFSPHNADSMEQYAQDTMETGFHIGDPGLVSTMCREAARGVKFLQECGIEFACRDSGGLARRHASGSTYPRTLHQSGGLLGRQIIKKMLDLSRQNGATLIERTSCHQVLVNEGSTAGVVTEKADGSYQVLRAPIVVVAWGGAGTLFPETTYPADVDGRGLAIAFECGARLVDLEFIEFEPTVMVWPPAAKGELFLTALLGEGAHLRNLRGERFLLRDRPQGEAGCPKTILNRAIWRELSEGRGTEHHAIYADLRHLPLRTVQAFSWFYERLQAAGLDPQRDLLEVAPVPHSHSGGIAVNSSYQTDITGLYAVGEAMGGIHGACRMAGNSATQALVSGLLSAEAILNPGTVRKPSLPTSVQPVFKDERIRKRLLPEVKASLARALGPVRNADTLKKGMEDLTRLHECRQVAQDDFTRQTILSGLLLIQASLFRLESRGAHFRSDYPLMSDEWLARIEVKREADGVMNCRKVCLSHQADSLLGTK
jgi:aspartate oxidase